ncbi:chemotaxis protein CheW [Niveibacterium microcysteis]|uniref:Chemotaxis protein CheA n=1 Tax=Niveibacterium microcysteis TaxID=2811415 RepID=A0ABX7M111_9RHOO|nr:chemotaxis protein CheW [Niveibacterium microcysteis]QSI75458.1 chemotaxis protein CheW [Niveibacterium microcysteis]
MSFDMSQFHAVFFEESREHLENMESLLLAVDVAAPESGDLPAIFRAAHSIKGSAATFGFTDVAELTHVMETLLDLVRNGAITLTEEMVDACLAAGDVLRNLLDAHQGHGEADHAAAEAMRARLAVLAEEAQRAVGAIPAAPGTHKRARTYQLGFAMLPGDPQADESVANLIAELKELGEVIDARPPAEGARTWSVKLASDVDPETLRTVLEFVVDSASVSIDVVDAAPVAPKADEAFGLFDDAPGAPAAEETAYGFFEPLSEPAPTSSSDDPGYGFFETLPDAASAATSDAADGSYGFFEPLPQPAMAAERLSPAIAATTEVAPRGTTTPAAQPAKDAAARPVSKSDASSIRVNIERVDQMINLVGELVITQAMISQAAGALDPVLYERLHNGIALLERNTRDLQESVMSIRMLPISTVFNRFPRVVRDLSGKLGKRVELVTGGENTELDKGLVELIADPLTHLIRNSLDHGIESPERRREAGKSETGRINLRAYHQSGNIVIEVADDGAGLNRNRILAKARERGLPVSDSMTDQEVFQLIFEPGFSTAEQVTDVSGRGVGMDVVKRNIGSLGGRIELDSMLGVGTRVTVRLPLTLAILDGMSVGLAGETYIIPLDYVVESLQPTAAMLKAVSGVERLLDVRGEYLPIVDLHEAFDTPGERSAYEAGIMVILESDGNKVAAFVDALIGQHQVVIKSLEANYRRVPGISGATIMGDGHVALIVDPPQLVSMARRAGQGAA